MILIETDIFLGTKKIVFDTKLIIVQFDIKISRLFVCYINKRRLYHCDIFENFIYENKDPLCDVNMEGLDRINDITCGIPPAFIIT